MDPITNEEVIKGTSENGTGNHRAVQQRKEVGADAKRSWHFYDALTKPENIKDFYQNNELIDLTRELTEMLRKIER